jgi:hypothetical protein
MKFAFLYLGKMRFPEFWSNPGGYNSEIIIKTISQLYFNRQRFSAEGGFGAQDTRVCLEDLNRCP